MAEQQVNAVWKWIAMVTTGILIGGAPGYISLAMDQHTAMTRVDVDREITVQNAVMVQQVQDLKELMNDKLSILSGQVKAIEEVEGIQDGNGQSDKKRERNR